MYFQLQQNPLWHWPCSSGSSDASGGCVPKCLPGREPRRRNAGPSSSRNRKGGRKVKRKPGLIALGFLLATLLQGMSLAAGPNGGYAEKDSCLDCHADKGEQLGKTVHGFAQDSRTPMGQMGCQTCHGPGAAHVDEGGGAGVGGMLDLASKDVDPSVTSAVCMQCHTQKNQALWAGSPHESRGLSCATCHSVHGGQEKNLKLASVTDTCAQCHKKTNSDFRRLSHHPVFEGRLSCSDCHNPHGTVAEKLISSRSVRDKCLSCHAEHRGPHVFEHSPVTEDCRNCHTPHGSQHERLLKVRTPFLCQTCHSNSRHPGTIRALDNSQAPGTSIRGDVAPSGGWTDARILGRNCLGCHSSIHGSNHPAGATFLR